MKLHRGAMVCALTLGIALLSTPARAWDFDEHATLGMFAYLSTCRTIEGVDGTRVGRGPQIVEFLCGPEATTRLVSEDAVRRGWWSIQADAEARLDDVTKRQQPVGGSGMDAETYGHLNAIAGDHLDSVSALESTIGERHVISWFFYRKLAVSNGEHFHPRALLVWREHHDAALAIARRVPEAPSWSEAAALVRRALLEEAFGAHFLEDSFAAGHVGFNRPGSRPSPSLFVHNRQGRVGVTYQDAQGQIWNGLGDGMLDKSPNSRRRAAESVRRSLMEVVQTMLHSSQAATPEPTELVPVYVLSFKGISAHARKHPVTALLFSSAFPQGPVPSKNVVVGAYTSQIRKRGTVESTGPGSSWRPEWMPVRSIPELASITSAAGTFAGYRTEHLGRGGRSGLVISQEFLTEFYFGALLEARVEFLDLDGSFDMGVGSDVIYPLLNRYGSLVTLDAGLGARTDGFVDASVRRQVTGEAVVRLALDLGYFSLGVHASAGRTTRSHQFPADLAALLSVPLSAHGGGKWDGSN